ncbi:uncharacterized protein sll0103 [Phtheirospermum japonicum]|uniref:Uncharacterized protein sll0103 n=1 Tax=Phtheirospermum japonicum TaxID=374723 RepID=A0A830CB50_9LAMI|nr:uncharacterized protein sll0103 [Phtheirospermum japonicum]
MASSENKTCAICLGNVETGQGQAIFTAECSHSFHFSCISQSVTHGNYLCPVCRAKWNVLPFLMPRVSPNVTMSSQVPPPPPPAVEHEPLQFSDDEPLPPVTTDPTSNASLQNVVIKTVPELHAVAASESLDDFAVLVRLRAPPLPDDARQVQRAPIDLVTVLDVSGSMRGPKLALLKRAVSFVVDNLGPSDRLSIVCFSTRARRILPLRRMTERGRVDAKWAVDSLLATGSTNILDGLTKGVQVLEERRQQNPVSSIIFLSDGRDTCNHSSRFRNLFDMWQPPEYLHLLPASICPADGETENQQTIPVHTFGFGSDHDPLAMHAISDSSGGMFSFIESYEIVQDAFASCIGGHLSIVIQELCITMRSASQGVDLKSISSGRYYSSISDQGSHGRITVGDLYADEEKEFLINVSVPVCMTLLLDISCSYKDVLSNETVLVEGDRVEIQRPDSLFPPDTIVNLEVDRQRNRLNAAEGIAEAQRIAETGDLRGARAILSNRRSSLLASASGQAGDGLSMWLEAEMKETEERMGSQEMYARSGRAYALSNMSAHGYQRATTRGSNAAALFDSFSFRGSSDGTRSSFDAYVTPSMANMVNKSQQINMAEDGNPREE